MAYQQPQTQYAPGQNVQNQEWQNSLCDCSPCDNCLLGTFLPCILLGQTADRMRDPTMATADNFNSDCMLFCGIQCVTGCGWIYAMMKRGEIRERFGIQGSGMGDCCTTYWCLCCALIQQEKEAKGRLSQGPVTQGYQSNKEGMHMPVPQNNSQPGVHPQMSPPPQQQQMSPPPQQAGYHTPQNSFPPQQQQQQQQYNPQQPPQY
ncbi:Fc.00g019120.m01.CDS01 [Cosmosporella sp. VM-42]